MLEGVQQVCVEAHVEEFDDRLALVSEEGERRLVRLENAHSSLDVGAFLGEVVVDVDRVEGVDVHAQSLRNAALVQRLGDVRVELAGRERALVSVLCDDAAVKGDDILVLRVKNPQLI